MRTVVVVGASLAGLNAARALREQQFEGRVVVVGAESHPPYDRPPLSKDFLAGRIGVSDLDLTAADDADLDLEWRSGVTATGLDTAASTVVLDSGEELVADGVVVATGARARPWPGGRLDGVHTLRTVEDAVELRAQLTPGARLVVVGGGFIGAEVASTAHSLGVEVTVIEADAVPMVRALGPEMGAVCAALHTDHGVRLLAGGTVAGLVGDTRVRGVRVGDTVEPADVVVVGIGAQPAVEWLAGSGVAFNGAGVLTDAAGATNIPQVVAAGDCTSSYNSFAASVLRQEHWTNAMAQPAAAVATLLGRPGPDRSAVPYFWSDQYGARLQFAGHAVAGDTVEVIDGDVASRSFAAVYRRSGVPVATFAMSRPKTFGRWRRELRAPLATTA